MLLLLPIVLVKKLIVLSLAKQAKLMLLESLRVKDSPVLLSVTTLLRKTQHTVTHYHIVFTVPLVKTSHLVVFLKVKKWQVSLEMHA